MNRKQQLSPAVRRAAQDVQDRLGAVLHSTSGMLEYDGDFMSDIEEIAEILAREQRDRLNREVPNHDHHPKEEDEKFHWGEAGYLVGVQVGLRLRTPGGAR